MQIKELFIGLVTTLIFTAQSNCQIKNATENLKQQAIKMSQSFIEGDYITFAKYNYPAILKMMGGLTKFAETMNKASNNMKSQGMEFSKIEIDDPSKMIKRGSELQCTVPQHTEMKLKQGRVMVTSTLIAISEDNGMNWSFLDTSNKDIAVIKKIIPGLSPQIVIPPQKTPVRYND